ncbi:MAG: hypothetical protein ACKVU1_00855 [bacterium]
MTGVAPGAHNARSVPLIVVALQAALLPLAGVPIWFRNEAPYHYIIARATPLLDSWKTYTEAINRPVVRVAEWAACHAFGVDATLHVLWNGALFVLFALVLARFADALFGGLAGWLSVVVLLAAFDIVFYPVFNAIHGVQYPLELLLSTGALYLMWQGMRGSAARFAAGMLCAAAAFFTHSMSVVVIPAAVAVMALSAGPEFALGGRRGRIAIVLLAPCALLLLPVVQSSGAPGGIMEKGGVGGALIFLQWRFEILAKLVMRLPAGPILLAGAFAAAVARGDAKLRGVAIAVAAAIVVALAAVKLGAEWLGLALFFVAFAIAAIRDRRLRFLFVWALAGAALFIVTREWSASYYRHLALPAALALAGTLSPIVSAIAARAPRRAILRPLASPLRAALLVASLSYVAVFAARFVPVPYVGAKVRELEYVKDLSFAFRDAIADAAGRVADGDTLLMYKGQSRDSEMESLYGEDFFLRLQPSKFPYYEWYFRLYGKTVMVEAVEARAAAARSRGGRALLAVNAWEIRDASSAFGGAPAREFRRGRARAALFEVEN